MAGCVGYGTPVRRGDRVTTAIQDAPTEVLVGMMIWDAADGQVFADLAVCPRGCGQLIDAPDPDIDFETRKPSRRAYQPRHLRAKS